MALYNYDSRILGRSHGDTAVSYAAYCAAEKLHDDYYGEVRNFTKKSQQERIYATEILSPKYAPSWVQDRETLWNKVEASEKRKDSQLCREIIISLPRELNHDQKRELIRRYAREQFVSKGMVADISLHNFEGKDAHNPHAHILLTTRKIEGDVFGKKEDSWRPKMAKDPKTKRVIVDPEFLKEERQLWQNYCNHALEQAGREERVDCRSLKDRGIDKTPAPKLGKAHAMEQREEWVGKTRAGDEWRTVKERNERTRRLKNLEQEQAALEREIQAAKTVASLEAERKQRQPRPERQDDEIEKQSFRKAAQTARVIAETQKPPTSSPDPKQPASPGHEPAEDEREVLQHWLEEKGLSPGR